LKIGAFEGTGSVWPKISGTSGRLPPTILRVEKLDKRYTFIWHDNFGRGFFRFTTIHTFDGRMDLRSPILRCIYNAVQHGKMDPWTLEWTNLGWL